MHNPFVTVLMPVYNAEPYLREAIDSILSQTYTNFEFLIINDGSSDQSETIITSYGDTRIRYIKNQSNIKLISTLNKGIELAKGFYIARMDADDISLPDRLQTQVDFMERHQDVTVCGTWFETIGANVNTAKYKTSHQDIMYKMLYQCHIAHPTTIMRTDHIRTFKTIFDPTFAHAEDYDFFTRVGHKYKLANIPKVLLQYRQHEDSVSAKFKIIQSQNSIAIRHREFEILGCSISTLLLEDFCSLNYFSNEKVRSTVNEIQYFLEDLVSANKKSNTFNQPFWESTLSCLWFNYCYHVSDPKTFYKSKALSTNIPVSPSKILKWQLRNLFKS